MPAIHDGDTVVDNARKLAKAAKLLTVPIIGTAQYPAGLGPNIADLHALCDSVIAKNDFNACAEPAFLAALDATNRCDLIMVGCEAHVCVLQTVLGLLQANRRVHLVVDAIGSRQPISKTIAMERVKAAGAELVTTEMVMFEWMRSSKHPLFKDMLQLIK